MPILFQINVVANSGSTGHIAEELGHLAISTGWESYIAYGRWACPSKSTLIQIGNKLEILAHYAKSLFFDLHGLSSKRATKKLISQIKLIKPDIIHLHNIHGYYLNYELLFDYLRIANIPVVWTLHDCWSMTGHCVHFQDIGCEKWITQCNHCPNISGYPKSLFRDNSIQNYCNKKKNFTGINNLTIVPVCSWLDHIVEKSFLKNYKRCIIGNGINLNVFSPYPEREKVRENLGIISKFMILAVATVWNDTKGWSDILGLHKILNNDFTIVIVGLTAKQLKILPDGIIGIMRTENVTELSRIYSAADVFINPTYQDTLPTVNMEALASGTPVITYDTGGSGGIVNENTGFVVERGNINGLIYALKIVKSKGKKSYEQACRDFAVKFYNKDDKYKEYLYLYNQLLIKSFK